MSTSASESAKRESSRPLLHSALAGIAVGLLLWLGSGAVRAAWGDEYGYFYPENEVECNEHEGGGGGETPPIDPPD